MTDHGYRLAVGAVFLGALAVGTLLRVRFGIGPGPVRRSADGRWMALALGVGGFAFYGSLLAFVAWPPLLGWSGLGLPAAVRWAGLPLLAGGFALALWARYTLGSSSTVTAVPAPEGQLVTRGPYRWLRHPIYSAGLLTLPGAAALTDSGFVLVVGLLLLITLDLRTRREERLLVERFGDAYRHHMDRTGRWLPRWPAGDA